MIEGIDYSRGGPLTSAQLKAAGKSFVGRYAVNDKSPNGRGITAAEYAELTTNGISVFVYWESSEGWMMDGYAAGVQAAINAQNNLNEAGMPHDTPVYFACDFDAAPTDQPEIDACLRGCAEVIGINRVGLYAGYWPLLRAKQNRTATWFCQTIAWSGGNLMDGVHLYQYDTSGNYIAGVDVDLVRAYQDNYGQTIPPEIPHPKPAPSIPWGRDATGPQQLNDRVALAFLGEVMAKRRVPIRYTATSNGEVFATMQQGDKAVIRGSVRQPNASRWALVEINGGVGRAPLSAFSGPWPTT